MKIFANIVAGFPAFPATIGNNPPLTLQHNAGGAGFTPSLIAELNAGVHITIYQTSWDGVAAIPDATGGTVNVGPHCLHLTAGTEHWFRQYDGKSWNWVTDHGTPDARSLKVFSALLNTLEPHLH